MIGVIIAAIALAGAYVYLKQKGTFGDAPTEPTTQQPITVITGANIVKAESFIKVDPQIANYPIYQEYKFSYGGKGPYDWLIAATIDISYPSVSYSLVKAIMAVESNFNPNALRAEGNVLRRDEQGNSYTGTDYSVGLMQIRTDTARWLRNEWHKTDNDMRNLLLDPVFNVFTGIKYIQYQRIRYSLSMKRDTSPSIETVSKIAASYNAGSIRYVGNSEKFVNQIYVDKVVAAFKKYAGDFIL